MRKIISWLLLLAMILAMATGCEEEPFSYVPTGSGLEQDNATTAPTVSNTKQQLSLTYYPDRSMNPYESTALTNRVLFSLLYQGLFSVDRNGTAVPILCDTYQMSDDMMTYTFYPAKAYFSDGTPLTVADVAASLKAARAGEYYSGRFQHITSIAEEEGGVVMKLDTPFENLPLLLDIPIVKASQVKDPQPLGTGPYQMDESAQGKWLRRQTGWWCSASLAATASFITLTEAEDTAQIRNQFEFSQISLVCADPGASGYAEFRCDYELWDCENGLFLYLVCNEESKFFSNAQIRSALTHAIDRDTLVERYYRDFARSAFLPVSPQSPVYNTALAENYGYDPEIFTQAVKDAELENAQITLLVNKGDTLRVQAANAIARQLEACGITVTVQAEEQTEYLKQLSKGNYDLYLGQTKLSANMDLSAFFAPEGTLNYGGLEDTAIYALCQKALANSGNFYNLCQQIMDEGQLCPILFRSYAIFAARGVLTGLTPARDNIFYYSLGRTLQDAYVAQPETAE